LPLFCHGEHNLNLRIYASEEETVETVKTTMVEITFCPLLD